MDHYNGWIEFSLKWVLQEFLAVRCHKLFPFIVYRNYVIAANHVANETGAYYSLKNKSSYSLFRR